MSFLVRQPNGLLGYFDTRSDQFAWLNLDARDALTIVWEDRTELHDAADALIAALTDRRLQLGPEPDGQPLYRWREALETIEMVHGEEQVAEAVRAGSDQAAGEPVSPELVELLTSLSRDELWLEFGRLQEVAKLLTRQLRWDLLGSVNALAPEGWQDKRLVADLPQLVDEASREGLLEWFSFLERLHTKPVASEASA